ncbi:Hypothetical predicted protein, partial [Podarcis lilfordi]
DREAGGRAAGLGRAMGLARLLAPHLVPGSALLLVACSVAMLKQLEGELHATCPSLCVCGLPTYL